MIKLKYGNFKDCNLRVPYSPTYGAVKLSDGNKSWFFGCVQGNSLYEISSVLAKSIGLDIEKSFTLEHVQPIPCMRIQVEPADEDSWEVISFNTDFIENNLLGQIRVVQTGMMLPLWVQNCCAWIRIIEVDGAWGQLQKDSEIVVKPRERPRKINFKELRAISGGIGLITNEFPEDSLLACIKDKCFVLGLSQHGQIREGHISGNQLEKFSRYKVIQVFPIQENIICFLNKYTLEVKVSQGSFTVACSEEEFSALILKNPRILLYDGMKIKVGSKQICVSLVTQVSLQEWTGFVLLTDPKLISYQPPSIDLKLPYHILKLPSFTKFCIELSDELNFNEVLVVEGAPGVGKSSILSLMSEILEESYTAVVRLSCRQFSSKEFPSNLCEAIETAETKIPCVLVIDDTELACGRIDDNQNEQSKLQACQSSLLLLSYLDRNRSTKSLKFIISCKHSSCLHPLLLSSSFFTMHFSIPSLTQQDVCSIFGYYFPSVAPEVILPHVKSFNISDIINFCKLTKLQVVREEDTIQVIENFLQTFTPQALERKEASTKVSWDEIGGMFAAKEKILDAFQFPVRYSRLYATYPLKLRSGMLLYGPPGCGKTLIASAIPSICEMSTICVKGPELLNKYIGASEQAVREVFERAKRVKPSAIIFDEFEAIVPKRGSSSTAVTDRIVNQFLCELDGVESRSGVYVIAVSSRPELIDPALLRPGRLDFHVYCPFPDSKERADILRIMFGRLGISIDYNEVGEIIDGYTGADIQGLMNNLQIRLAHGQSVTITDILQEIRTFSPSFNSEKRQQYEERYLLFANKKVIGKVGRKQVLI